MERSAGHETRARLLKLLLPLAGLAILGLVIHQVDVPQALEVLRRIGMSGAALFFVNVLLTIGGPLVAWHLLMRRMGIRVSLGTALISGLLGRAVNLFSPFSYFGGESLRTYHIAAMARAPRRLVLATLVVSEFQVMAGLTVFALVALGIWATAPALAGSQLSWAAAGTAGITLLLVLLLALFLGNVKPSVRILDLLIRWGIFRQTLSRMKTAALDLERAILSLFVEHPATFFLSQAVSLSSPIAQFLRPLLFFWILRQQDASVSLPSFRELCVFFVLSQLIFMLPSTPGGLGVYEAGVLGLFKLLGWNGSEGIAYGLLLRLDDVLFLTAAGLTLAFGGAGLLWKPVESQAPADPRSERSKDEPAEGLDLTLERRPE